MKIRNPDYQSHVRDTFSKQGFMTMIGAVISRLAPGEVEIELPSTEELLQHHGYLHGAVIAGIVDTACGCSALTLMPPGFSVLTVEYKVNFLAPATGELIVARGRVVKSGRRLTVCSGDAFAVADGEERLVAALVATMVGLPGRVPGE